MSSNQLNVMTAMRNAPNRSYAQMFFWVNGLSRGTWNYWAKKLETMGLAESHYNERGCYSWYGYKLTRQGIELLASVRMVDIPF